MNARKIGGTCLIVVPIVIFLIIAAINGFSIAHCWVVSCGVDRFLGSAGAVAIVIGAILLLTRGEEKEKEKK